jgi:hypothetical protein
LANALKGGKSQLSDGVKTIHRSDTNFEEASAEICSTVIEFTQMDNSGGQPGPKARSSDSKKALWKHFSNIMMPAYDDALRDTRALVSHDDAAIRSFSLRPIEHFAA